MTFTSSCQQVGGVTFVGLAGKVNSSAYEGKECEMYSPPCSLLTLTLVGGVLKSSPGSCDVDEQGRQSG